MPASAFRFGPEGIDAQIGNLEQAKVGHGSPAFVDQGLVGPATNKIKFAPLMKSTIAKDLKGSKLSFRDHFESTRSTVMRR